MARRTALHICCSEAEAQTIRSQAREELRTVSGYVLKVMLRVLTLDESLLRPAQFRRRKRPQPVGPRTSMLVRCSVEDANRIQSAADRKGMTTSLYVLEQLRRSWKVRGVSNER